MEQVMFSFILLAIVFLVLFLYGCLRCIAVASVDSNNNINNRGDIVDNGGNEARYVTFHMSQFEGMSFPIIGSCGKDILYCEH